MIENFIRLWREPLIHFLIGGALIYALYGVIGETDASDGRKIVVDRSVLLNYMQYRAKAFQPEFFAEQLDKLSQAELNELVSGYVEEEILYREARAYHLDQSDDVIRQRLIQKTRFLLDTQEAERPPTEAELRGYFNLHRSLYTRPASVTFTHVFFDDAVHGTKAEQMASKAVINLNTRNAAFSDAPQYGGRFPFLVNYVERQEDLVASHLGPQFAQELRSAQVSQTKWQGPYRSPYGWHAVLLVERQSAEQLPFAQVRDEVLDAYMAERQSLARKEILERLRSQYQVKLEIEQLGRADGG